MLVQINNGTQYYGVNDVFSNINFSINEKEKVAIIGRNGCGKTTLLKIISGEEELTSGEIFRSSKIEIAYLKQNALSHSERTIREEFYEVFADLIEMEHKLEELSNKLLTNHDDKLVNEYSNLQDEFKSKGGYTYLSEIKTILHGFGFYDEDLDRKVSSFSGGEKTKIAFGKLLLKKPDLLLLDEPTNHLDLSTIEWLESYLANYSKALIIVSHDRTFIDKTVNIIYELENDEMIKYVGNYASYLVQKENNQLLKEKAYARQQKEIKRLEELIEKFRYKANKAAFAQSKIKYLDRMDKLDKPNKADNKTFNARFTCDVKGGKNVLSLDHYKVGYSQDKPLLEVTLDIHKGDRICVMGDNGCGKSTLLKTIIDQIPELSGYKLFGHQIEYSYFDQNIANINSNKTVLNELWDLYPSLDLYQIRSVLALFQFTSDDVFKEVNVLSGGEKVRLLLAKIMMEKKNFLILDEPTNHLDILSKEALEKALNDYEGTILFVSHDRYFISKIATSCLVINKDGTTTYYEDGYKDYIDKKKPKVENKQEVVEEKIKVKQKIKPKYDIKKLEAQITELEEMLEIKRELRFEPEYYQDTTKMKELDEEIDEVHNMIADVMKKWEEAMEEQQ